MLGHERLDEERARLRDRCPAPIQSATLSSALSTMLVGRRVVARQRVPVGDEVEAVVLALQRHPVLRARRPDGRDAAGRSAACPRRRALRGRHEQPITSTAICIGTQSIARACRRASARRESGIRTAGAARSARATGVRQHAHQHVAAVERRHGNHVEDARAARSIDTPMNRKTVRTHTDSLAVDGRAPTHDHPNDRDARSARIRLLTGPAARRSRSRAAARADSRTFTGTGFAQPISGSPEYIAISGNSTVPIQSMCASGLSVSRPEQPGGRIAEPIGRPRVRRLVKRQRQDEHDESQQDFERRQRTHARTNVPRNDSWPHHVSALRSAESPPRPPWRRRRPPARRGWRGARRRPIRTSSAAACAGAGRCRQSSSSADRRSRFARARRWNVTANRCASSRMRCTSRSAGDCRAAAPCPSARSRVNISSSCFARPTATSRSRPSSRSAAYAAVSCPLPPSITIRSGNGPPCSSTRLVAPQDDLVHRREVVEDQAGLGVGRVRVRLRGPGPVPDVRGS